MFALKARINRVTTHQVAPGWIVARRGWLPLTVLILLMTLFGPDVYADKIGEISSMSRIEQAKRFFTLQDASVRHAVLGAIFLGISCGLLGCFIVVRRLSLMGDALSHAVLPGVAIGFLWNMTKDPIAIFWGATIAGLLGAMAVSLIGQTTAIKQDSALGMILAGFYGLGIVLFTMIQNMPLSDQAGLDKYLFGQAAALSVSDIKLMGVVALLAIVLVVVFYKEFLVTSFDADFARSLGVSERFFHYLMMLLLAFAVVVSLQAVGVVLVSALLITPASAAYMLTDRMHRMLILAALFGMFSGIVGAFLSFMGNSLPTGPFIVLGASMVFALAFLFGPRHGLVAKALLQWNSSRRIRLENTLKAVYQVREAGEFSAEGVSLSALAARSNTPLQDAESAANALVKEKWATFYPSVEGAPHLTQDKTLFLTPLGWKRACQIVRNHRLWELYLTNAAHYKADHVHEDAEIIEHVLGEDIVRKLEKRLNYPKRDPHGKLIPGLQDMHAALIPSTGEPGAGYTRPYL